MGRTRFDQKLYQQQAQDRVKSHIPTFAHSQTAKATGKYDVDARLNPAGKKRVSRDVPERPRKTPIVIAFDVTGSMQVTPEEFQGALPQTMGLLQLKNYCTDPDILPMAFGNCYVDKAPIQFGSFNGGNELDEEISAMILEGNGGDGDWRESPEMVLAFLAYRTMHDHMDKRGLTGYAFLSSDEGWRDLDHNQYNSFFEPEEPLTQDIPFAQVLADARKLYDVFFILPAETSGAEDSRVLKAWHSVFDEKHFLNLPESKNIAQLIASVVGLMEGEVDVTTLRHDLIASGSSVSVVNIIEKAVSMVDSTPKGAIATGLPKSSRGTSSVKRLS